MTVLVTTAAGVRHRSRWVFRDLEILVEPGDMVAVTGPPGSGRTMALLSLAGRFRLSAGSVDLLSKASLGYVPGVTEPEPTMTVAEHVTERFALVGGRGRDVALFGLDPATRGWALLPYERQLLGIVLAQIEDPRVIALDGVDEGLDTDEQKLLLEVLHELSDGGTAVIFTARHVDPAEVTTVVAL